MKLYYVPNACSLAAHIALEWCGANYETIATEFGDEILYKLNPIGTVGILDRGERDGVLSQTPAILLYLSRQFPDAEIGAKGSISLATELDKWLSFLVSDVHHAFHLLFNPRRYAIAGNEAARQAALDLCYRNFAVLEAHLEGRAAMLGDHRSILDAYLFPMIRWSYVQFPEEKRSFSSLNALHDRMLEDPAVERAMRAEGIWNTIRR